MDNTLDDLMPEFWDLEESLSPEILHELLFILTECFLLHLREYNLQSTEEEPLIGKSYLYLLLLQFCIGFLCLFTESHLVEV